MYGNLANPVFVTHFGLTPTLSSISPWAATGLWVLLPSMCADIIDFDEVQSGKRLEGAFTSVYSWARAELEVRRGTI